MGKVTMNPFTMYQERHKLVLNVYMALSLYNVRACVALDSKMVLTSFSLEFIEITIFPCVYFNIHTFNCMTQSFHILLEFNIHTFNCMTQSFQILPASKRRFSKVVSSRSSNSKLDSSS